MCGGYATSVSKQFLCCEGTFQSPKFRDECESFEMLGTADLAMQCNSAEDRNDWLHCYIRPTTYSLQCTVGPRFTNSSVHEQIFRAKNFSDDERFLGLRTRKLATAASWEYQRGSQLLVDIGSVHIPAWYRFTDISVRERPPGTDKVREPRPHCIR
jgi:hypothetical protein